MQCNYTPVAGSAKLEATVKVAATQWEGNPAFLR
jgi:hypothetical protein|tara:strand:- start:93 stop:194 length:102 start_codon:yes stop_codon:yes gene_type:complete